MCTAFLHASQRKHGILGATTRTKPLANGWGIFHRYPEKTRTATQGKHGTGIHGTATQGNHGTGIRGNHGTGIQGNHGTGI